MIFSHMYTTNLFSCNLMCSINNYVSGTKCTQCTVLSNNQNKQIILVYYCSNMVWSNRNHNFFLMWMCFVINLNSWMDLGCFLFIFLITSWLKNIAAVTKRYYLCSVMVTVWVQVHSVLVSQALKYVNSLLHIVFYKPHIKKFQACEYHITLWM